MNYEKKYKEALEKARQLCVYPTTKPFISDLQDLFPELKESKDERIRKLCEVLVRTCFMNELCTKEDKNDCIAWLEKQGEPQIRTNIEWANAIDNACNKRYTEEYSHGEYCHEQSFKWGFQEGVEWLEKQVEQIDFANKEYWRGYHEGKLEILDKYADLEKRSKQKLVEKYGITGIGSKNAQGKLGEMIKEMESANKVEPKFKVGDWIYHEISGNVFHINRIENRTYISDEGATISFGRQNDWRFWNIQDAKSGDVLVDEDNNIGICKEIESIYWDSYIYLGCDGELRGFSIGGKHKQTDTHPATKEQRDLLFQKMKESGYEWDTDKKELIDKIEPKFKVGDIISDGFSEVKIISIEKNNYIVTNDEIKNDAHICNWVVYFKDQDNWKLVKQKSTWSEEDEEVLNLIIARLHSHPNVDLEEYSKEYNWLNYNLKSLKERYSWKPTEEQLKQLRKYCPDNTALTALYEYLKQL